jgi:hypothetical protein
LEANTNLAVAAATAFAEASNESGDLLPWATPTEESVKDSVAPPTSLHALINPLAQAKYHIRRNFQEISYLDLSCKYFENDLQFCSWKQVPFEQ